MSDYAKQMELGKGAQPGYVVATLPANPPAGTIAFVTDQITAPAAKGVAPAAGGAIRCLVFYNGAGWVGA